MAASVRLMLSTISGVSLRYRPCYEKTTTANSDNLRQYENVNLWQRQQIPKIYDSIKVDFFDCRTDTGFCFEH